jgi:hypothetical protein
VNSDLSLSRLASVYLNSISLLSRSFLGLRRSRGPPGGFASISGPEFDESSRTPLPDAMRMPGARRRALCAILASLWRSLGYGEWGGFLRVFVVRRKKAGLILASAGLIDDSPNIQRNELCFSEL